MRVARILTNLTCNQGCRFCHSRAAVDDAVAVAPGVVLGAIVQALRGGAQELILTGGEPTLRRDLETLVALARRQGAPRLTLETNGALVDGRRARALAQAGLHGVRIHLPAWGEAADRLTRDPGGFARTLVALRAFAAAGLTVEASAPVVAESAALLPALPEAIRGADLPVSALLLHLGVVAPDEASLLPLAEAARVVAATDDAARAHGLPVRLDPGFNLPPCLLADPGRRGQLYALSPGGAPRADHRQLAACALCAVADRCPGVPRAALERSPAPPLRPLVGERLRRRLSLVGSVGEQVARELVTDDLRRGADGTLLPERIVRIHFACNQACDFCFVSTHLPPPEERLVEAAIDELGARGGILTLSGGEPTLSPRLLDYVRRGKAHGAARVELQTNALRIDEALARDLAAAGLDLAFVSLHGATAEISDAVTAAPGTFARTARGLDHLAAAGVTVNLNFVTCGLNAAQFPEYVDLVARRWPQAGITISFVAPSTDLVPRDRRLIPRYSEVLPHLAEGCRRARAHGLAVTGLDSMCGLPLCLVPEGPEPFFPLAELPSGYDRGEFLHPEVCDGCALRRRCHGLRRGYAGLYGSAELRPIAPRENRSP